MLVSMRVWGDFALFTRPEAKVERFGYPLMTPSAARGILEAVHWKPEFRWKVKRIHVYKRGHEVNVRRNEVQRKAHVRIGDRIEPMLADSSGRDGVAGEIRTQRNSLLLANVDYGIDAEIVPLNGGDVVKHMAIFNRRLASGQCFHRPALGCREFAANFAPSTDDARTVEWTEDLGLMLFDIHYPEKSSEGPLPLFFHARIENGTMQIRDEDVIGGIR